MIELYSLPECGICEEVKEEIKKFSSQPKEKQYQYYVTYHDGWRNDESVDILTARHFFGEDSIPLIKFEDKIYNYDEFKKFMDK